MRATAMLLIVALAVPAVCLADSKQQEKQAVEQASARFYAGLNALFTGNAEPMKQIWSHADDVTYMGPRGGFLVGWQQIEANWEAQAALKLRGRVEPAQARFTVGNDLAFVQCFEQGDNFNAQGKKENVSIRATTFFRKENGQWKVIGHQTDILPFLVRETLTRSQESSGK